LALPQQRQQFIDNWAAIHEPGRTVARARAAFRRAGGFGQRAYVHVRAGLGHDGGAAVASDDFVPANCFSGRRGEGRRLKGRDRGGGRRLAFAALEFYLEGEFDLRRFKIAMQPPQCQRDDDDCDDRGDPIG